MKFYEEALGLKEVRRKEAEDGSFILVYLGDGKTGFQLELTWLRDWEKDHYDLGDNEIHLAFTTDNMEAAHQKHEKMGCICYENPQMGIEISYIPRDLITVIFYYQISLNPLKTQSLSQVSFPLLFPLRYIVPPVFTNSDKGKNKGKKII